MILAGDIGGTKTVLGLFTDEGGALTCVRESRFHSGENPTLESILRSFLEEASPRPRLTGACFGIAGPVENGSVKTTNLPWIIDTDTLAGLLDARVVLLNDLAAAAYGMLTLPDASFRVLQPDTGAAERGNIAVIAPGTGLGEAMLFFDGSRYHPVASEGGHADFAPRSTLESELRAYLAERFGHVSYERVLAGNGFSNLLAFLRETGRAPVPAWLDAEIDRGHPNSVITRAGLDGRAEICVRVLELWADILGAEAGNLALRSAATDGVIVGGGIPPKVLPALERPAFVTAFRQKGRMTDWLSRRLVKVALEPRAPLIGAAHYLQDSGGLR